MEVDHEYQEEFRKRQEREERRLEIMKFESVKKYPHDLICAVCGKSQCMCAELHKIGYLEL